MNFSHRLDPVFVFIILLYGFVADSIFSYSFQLSEKKKWLKGNNLPYQRKTNGVSPFLTFDSLPACHFMEIEYKRNLLLSPYRISWGGLSVWTWPPLKTKMAGPAVTLLGQMSQTEQMETGGVGDPQMNVSECLH